MIHAFFYALVGITSLHTLVLSKHLVHPCFDEKCPHWNDTDGNRIEAHAAGMLQSPLDKRWYWYGESKKTNSLADHGVNCYSSAYISGPWRNEGQVFHQQNITIEGKKGPFIVERPKVLFNTKTKMFVMWFHLDTAGYKYRHAGVATSSIAKGPFHFSHSLQPDGIPSLDMSLFRDPVDGQAYFVRSCNNAYTGISRLTADYLNSTGIISNHSVFEGMALFRHPNGTYYIVTSHLTGWSPNPLMLFRAAGKTLDDPQWVNMGNPTGDHTSFNTQPTYVVSYTPSSGKSYFVYMADNWVHGGPDGLIDASYVWLPFQFKTNSVILKKQTVWDLENPFPVCVPKAGDGLSLQLCDSDNIGQQWILPNTKTGPVKLNGTDLCVSYISPGSNLTPLILGDCNQNFTFGDEKIVDSITGRCWDVKWCGNQVCHPEVLELYDCNGEHPNQIFSLSQEQLISKIDGKCISVCM